MRAQLGTPNRRASGPRFLQPCTGVSRGPPRSLTVVPLIADKSYYGEAPVGLRWDCGDERAVGDAVPPPNSTENSEEPKLNTQLV
jgi:hypothetical protein